MTRKKTKQRQKNRFVLPASDNQTFMAHIYELRRRLIFIVLFLIAFSALGYVLRHFLIAVLLGPAADQNFIYTSPGGGFDFYVRVCLFFGFAMSVPVIMYQLLRFLEPLLTEQTKNFVVRTSAFSCIMAVCGMAFGYFVALPFALRFLLSQFETSQVTALLTIQEYTSFVSIYLVGFAALFQIPLLLLFTNRITPLKPGNLMKFQRFIIAGAFILAAIITPTGDMVNMSIMALPIILMYQLGVVLVWLANRDGRSPEVAKLLAEDARKREERLNTIRVLAFQPVKPTEEAFSATVGMPAPQVKAATPAVMAPKMPSPKQPSQKPSAQVNISSRPAHRRKYADMIIAQQPQQQPVAIDERPQALGGETA